MKKTSTLLFFAVISTIAIAQTGGPQVLSTAGAFMTGASSTLSLTVGEPVIATASSATVTLTQGFQQPDLLTIGINENSLAAGTVGLFPNPVSSQLNLSFDLPHDAKITMLMTDLLGNRVIAASGFVYITGHEIKQLDVSALPNGTYFLELYAEHDNTISRMNQQVIIIH